MNIDSTHTIQFCCGTSCDAQANLAYVKELEMELKAAQRTIRLLRREYGLTEGDTTGAT